MVYMKNIFFSPIFYAIFIFLNFSSQATYASDEVHFLKQKPTEQDNQRFHLPENHPVRTALDKIFKKYPKALDNQKSFAKAGFVTLYRQHNQMMVAKHASLPGYLVKVYLIADQKSTKQTLHRFTKRCMGAENIRELIKKEKLRYFTVPDKWLYTYPEKTTILVVTDANLVSREECKIAWKTKITHRHLKELYSILSHGFASCYLIYNIPYTKEGTFSCVDTAYLPRKHHYHHVKGNLSEKMKLYWDRVVETNGKP